jgi:hypothetical protein
MAATIRSALSLILLPLYDANQPIEGEYNMFSSKKELTYLVFTIGLSQMLYIQGCASVPIAYTTPGYDRLPVEEVLVIPATGLSDAEADALTRSFMSILRAKRSFNVTRYVHPQGTESNRKLDIIRRLRLPWPDDTIREIAEQHQQYDAILTIHQVTEQQPPLEFKTPLLPDKEELVEVGANGESRYLVKPLPRNKDHIVLRLRTVPSGSELWRLLIENKHLDNTDEIQKALPDDLN